MTCRFLSRSFSFVGVKGTAKLQYLKALDYFSESSNIIQCPGIHIFWKIIQSFPNISILASCQIEPWKTMPIEIPELIIKNIEDIFSAKQSCLLRIQ